MGGSKFKDLVRFLLILITVVIIGAFYTKTRNCEIMKNMKILYAIPYKFVGKSNYKTVKVKLFVEDKVINIEAPYDGLEPKIEQKYFIAFNKENIDQTVLFSNCPVPDSLVIPLYGWDKIPIPEYQDEVDAYFDKMLNKGIYKLFPKCD